MAIEGIAFPEADKAMAASLPPALAELLGATDPAEVDRAWTAFLNQYNRLILHVARSQGREHDAAMDVYAYVLEALREDGLRRLRAYSPQGDTKFTTWLVVVTRRLCLDWQRHRYGRAREPGAEKVEQHRLRRNLVDLLGEPSDPDSLADADSADPEHELVAREQHQALEAALSALLERDRLLLALRFEYDLPAREIGRLMEFPTPFHVYRRLNTLMDRLRRLLKEWGVEEASPPSRKSTSPFRYMDRTQSGLAETRDADERS
jgi:RNA polymerase sigma factor (sigma-70 family)